MRVTNIEIEMPQPRSWVLAALLIIVLTVLAVKFASAETSDMFGSGVFITVPLALFFALATTLARRMTYTVGEDAVSRRVEAPRPKRSFAADTLIAVVVLVLVALAIGWLLTAIVSTHHRPNY